MARNKTAANKTQPVNSKTAVTDYLKSVAHVGRREDAQQLLQLMQRITGEPAVLWGTSIIGFGSYHYVYDSGREGDFMLTGFAPRKANMVLYVMPGFSAYAGLLNELGKYKTGKSCLYLGRLSSVNMAALETLITRSVGHMRKTYKVQ